MNRAERRARRSKKRGQYRGLKRLSGDSTFGSKVGVNSKKKNK
tara:strand:- start:163 stop:291 length:129 start_codon:yes stop_codon:yes gene_type:complete